MKNAIYYLRVSTDRQTDGAEAQLLQLRASSKAQNVPLLVTQDMLRDGLLKHQSKVGNLYLDFGVSGFFDRARTGFQEFLRRAIEDASVTHVFAPARDRLGR